MKLTKQQRHIAYIIMLAELEEKTEASSDGFCWLIKIAFGIQGALGEYAHNLKYFPELKAKKPNIMYKEGVGLWFPPNHKGNSQRIEIIKRCIEETY